MCAVGGLTSGSISTLSHLDRPKTRSWSAMGWASKARRSWTQRMTSTWLPAAPGPSGTSAAAGASSVVGFAVPSMNPVRSRLSRWTKAGRSVASSATSSIAPAAARACSNTTSLVDPLIHSQRSCWVAGA